MKLKKGLNTEKRIVRAAIKCVGTIGLHQTTFQKIADKSKVSQPLVMHYFKTRDDIFPKVWEHVYQEAIERTSNNLSLHKNPIDKLKEYIAVSWDQFNSDPALTKIYMQLHSLAVFDEKLRSINTQVKRIAIHRIAGIISEGQGQGIFSRNVNPLQQAKIIHIQLSGFILNGISENKDFDYEELLKEFTNSTLAALK
tara:strand:- start:54637 stop:55227 length:591 start_codon:yes stop_codon:yes gene_type:complete